MLSHLCLQKVKDVEGRKTLMGLLEVISKEMNITDPIGDLGAKVLESGTKGPFNNARKEILFWALRYLYQMI